MRLFLIPIAMLLGLHLVGCASTSVTNCSQVACTTAQWDTYYQMQLRKEQMAAAAAKPSLYDFPRRK